MDNIFKKKSVKLKPIVNKTNGQINFNVKKNCFSKNFKKKLPNLKFIKLTEENFEF